MYFSSSSVAAATDELEKYILHHVLCVRGRGEDRQRQFGVVRERTEPLATRVTREERAAHRRFIATLGDGAIWRDYFKSD